MLQRALGGAKEEQGGARARGVPLASSGSAPPPPLRPGDSCSTTPPPKPLAAPQPTATAAMEAQRNENENAQGAGAVPVPGVIPPRSYAITWPVTWVNHGMQHWEIDVRGSWAWA